jgi:pimeloyl-ACP methyl ester carboxylesterase
MKKSTILIAVSAALIGTANTASAQSTSQSCAIAAHAPRNITKVEGKRFTVQIEGNGPDIILIPGLATPRDVWEPTVLALARCYRVHSVQIRGFGDDAGINANGPVLEPFVRELADYMDTEIVAKGGAKPSVIGHSMGGLAALMIGTRYPALPDKIIIVDALPFFGVLVPGTGEQTVATVEPIAQMMRNSIISNYGKPIDPATTEANTRGMALKPESIAKMRIWAPMADVRVTAQLIYDDMTTDIRGELPRISVPVTVIYPWNDKAGPAKEQADTFYQNQYRSASTADFVDISDAAHFVMLDQPEKFQAALIAALKK